MNESLPEITPEAVKTPEIAALAPSIQHVKEGLESALGAMSLFKDVSASDIEALKKVIEKVSSERHLDVFNYLRVIERGVYDLRDRKGVSPQTFQLAISLLRGTIGVVTKKERGKKEKEAPALLTKRLPEIIGLLEKKVNARESVEEELFFAAAEKIKRFLDDYVAYLAEPEKIASPRPGEEEGEEMASTVGRIENLARFREIRQEILPYLGQRAMELAAGIGIKERTLAPDSRERFAYIQTAEKELAARQEIIKKIFGEEEAANLDNAAVLYRALNRHLEADTRSGYTPIFFSRMLLEFALRKDELAKGVSAKDLDNLIIRANNLAAYVNSRQYLDLGRMLKKGSLSKGVVQTFKLKMFLQVYPDIWEGGKMIREQFTELAGDFYRGLGKIYQEAGILEKVKELIASGKNPALENALRFETELKSLAGYGSFIEAIREAYGMNEKMQAEELLELKEHLKSVRKRKIIMKRGVGANERAKTLDQKLRDAGAELEKLRQEMARAEKELEGESPETREERLKELEDKISRVQRKIKYFERGRITERDIAESEFKILRFSEIEEALSDLAKRAGPEAKITEVMGRLHKILFTP